MRKFGSLAIACILAVTGLWAWYVEVHVPKGLLEKAADATARYSSSCEDECTNMLKAQTQYSESTFGLTCRRIDVEDAQFEICHRSLINPGNVGNADTLKQNQLKIRTRSLSSDISTDSIIDIGSKKTTATDRDVSYSSSDAHIFLGWIRQGDISERYSIFLKIIDGGTGDNLMDEEIFSKKCCIVNLSISYNRKNSKLLLAWNDWSHADDQNLFYAFLDITQLLNGDLNFEPIQLNTGDKWDKRSPYFLKDGEETYLVYVTGDHWGWLSYSGRQSIGVCAMSNANSPTAYQIVASNNPVGKVLKIKNGVLYYEVLSMSTLRPAEIRKMPLNRVFKMPLY